jgi:hypothetical protein
MLRSTALLTAAWLQLLAAAGFGSDTNVRINIAAASEKLEVVLDEFQKQSGIGLVYANAAIDSFRVQVRIADPPDRALRKILISTPFDFIQQTPRLWIILPRSQTRNLPATISGRVVDAKNQLPIFGANVYLAETNLAATTDDSGLFFLKKIPPGRHRLVAKRIGYGEQSFDVGIIGNAQRTIDMALERRPVPVPEVVIEESKPSKIYEASLTKQVIVSEHLSAPPIRNDGEIFEIVQQQPGVMRRDLDDVFPHIEGGSATEVLVEFDGIPIYVPTHGQNRRSIFAAPAIENVTLHRTGYDVQHGEAMSGVIQLDSKDFSEINYSVLTSVSLSGLSFNFKKKVRSLGWSGAWRVGKPAEDLNFREFEGQDFLNKFELPISPGKKITLLSLISHGNLAQSNTVQTEQLFNLNTGIRYESASLKNTLSALVYQSRLQDKQHEEGIKFQINHKLSPHKSVIAGLHIFNLHSTGSAVADSLEGYKSVREPFLDFPVASSNFFKQNAILLMPYWALNFEHKYWQLTAGLRAPANLRNGVVRGEPRADFSVMPIERLSFTIAAGLYHQFSDRSYASEAKSGDYAGTGEYFVKLPVSAPSVAKHLRAEAGVRISSNWTASLAVFRKNYQFNDRAYFSRINRWLWVVPVNSGKSDGLEFWLGKHLGKWQGWASFTLNRATYQTDDGTIFQPYFHRKRILNVSLIHHLSSDFQFKSQLFKASGHPQRNWNPQQVRIDPAITGEEFAERHLTMAGEFDAVNQMALGVTWFFKGFARQSAMNLVTVRTFDGEGSESAGEFRFWASISFAY